MAVSVRLPQEVRELAKKRVQVHVFLDEETWLRLKEVIPTSSYATISEFFRDCVRKLVDEAKVRSRQPN
jgi:hypothetical protein